MNRSNNTKKKSKSNSKSKTPLRGGMNEIPADTWNTYLNAMSVAVDTELRNNASLDAAIAAGVAAVPPVVVPPRIADWNAVLALNTRENQELKNAIIKGITSETTRLLSTAVTVSNMIPPAPAAVVPPGGAP